MKKKTAGELNIASAAVLLAGVVLLISLAALSYTAVLKSKDNTDALRGSLSYLRSQVKDHDSAGCVEVRDGGSLLVLKDIDDGDVYELRIYEKDGKLLEEYLPAEALPDPDEAEFVAETSVFRASFEAGNLLKLQTGEGTILVRLFGAKEGDLL